MQRSTDWNTIAAEACNVIVDAFSVIVANVVIPAGPIVIPAVQFVIPAKAGIHGRRSDDVVHACRCQ
jgi:hypothetical protein